MAYILQYFDDLVEETGMYYNKRNRISLDDGILSEEIRKEGMLIQDRLREIYYREGEEHWIVPYFLKISKRLISLLKTTELEIGARKPHLVIEYTQWANVSYENYHSVRREIIGILDILSFEFEVPGIDVEKISESGEQKIRREKYFEDHLLLKKYVLEKQEIPNELIEKYNLRYEVNELTPEYFQYSKLHSLKEEIGIDTIKSTYTIEEIEKEYKRDFINERQERSFVYNHIWEMLIDTTKDIISEEKKKKYIIDFFLHTGLCVSLVVHYFDREIRVMENLENADMGTYLKKISDWLDEVKAEPKYRKYHVSRIEDSYEDVFEEVTNILGYYEELYEIKGDTLVVDKSSKKIISTLKRKELAMLVAVMIETGVFGKNKTTAATVISNAFTIQGEGEITFDTFKNELTGWTKKDGRDDKVQEAIDNLLKKLLSY